VYVLASAQPDTLDSWRAALGEGVSIVEIRRMDGLSECLERLEPELLLLDLRLWSASVSRNIAQLLRVSPGTRIVAFSEQRGEDFEIELFRAGVRAVCTTDVSAHELTKVVSVVLNGEIWIRRALMPKLIDSLVGDRSDTASGTTGRFAILTPREIEIARLIGQGASNKRIARHLAITEQTVKGHLTAIFRKTGVADRVKLALLVARRH
jgi:DNA-binding NarL/FixJ family response regulator